MRRDVVTIEDHASCQEAVALMCRRGIRHLPVVGGDGRLRGIVTDRDLRHYLFAPGVLETVGTSGVERILSTAPVTRVMSTPVVTVAPDAPLTAAARLMLQDKVGSLPVVDGGRVTGIITETDLLRHVVGTDCGADVSEIVVSFP
ncbi:MAG TPA: CBS domain-containing protein [Methylomirabilota bacterium]|nr:CBS domain-containing protein [Methylomirabilota bacterium]